MTEAGTNLCVAGRWLSSGQENSYSFHLAVDQHGFGAASWAPSSCAPLEEQQQMFSTSFASGLPGAEDGSRHSISSAPASSGGYLQASEGAVPHVENPDTTRDIWTRDIIKISPLNLHFRLELNPADKTVASYIRHGTLLMAAHMQTCDKY